MASNLLLKLSESQKNTKTMKLKTIAMISQTLLGAALLGYGQAQAQGSPHAGNKPGTGVPASQPPATGEPDRQTNPGTPAPNTSNRNQGGNQARSNSQAGSEVDWENAEKSDMTLAEIPDAARNTLNSVTEDGKLADKVTRMKKGDQKVFMATVDRENGEDLHILVKEDGTVMKTKQKVDPATLPPSVRNSIETKLGANASTSDREVYRVIANNETTYMVRTSAEGEDEKGSKLHIDSTGQVIDKPMRNQHRSDGANSQDQTHKRDSASVGSQTPGTSTATPERRD